MNIYAESNFVLELALSQAQSQSCENILRLCESGEACLLLPAFCVVEPYDTLVRRAKERKELIKKLDLEFNQLSRTPVYTNQLSPLQDVSRLLTQSSIDEEQRLYQTLDKILKVCETIPVVPEILSSATTLFPKYKLYQLKKAG